VSEIKLTPEEAAQITRQRETAQRRRWIAEGVFHAADYLERLGQEGAGGDGGTVNPATGKRWCEEFFVHADMLKRHGAAMQAGHPDHQVNV